jgi:integrase
MAKRRGQGEGSIYKRADGRWSAQVTLPTGKRHTVYARTRRECAAKLAEVQADPSRTATPGRITVATYLDRWLASCRETLRSTTLSTYRSLVRCHIEPRIGAAQLGRLTPIAIQQLYADLAADKVSPRTRQAVHALLRRALGEAVHLGMLSDNAAARVRRPRVARVEVQALDARQVRRLLDAAKGDPYESLYVVAVTAGLRQGEIFGLKWKDIDLRRRRLSVRRSVVDAGGHRGIAEPKTAAGRRVVELPSMAVAALRAHREARLSIPHPEAFVFTDSRGGPLRRSNFLRRQWAPLLKRAKLEGTRFHDLRHTCASLLLLTGVHPKVVQERLGHATIAVTLGTYSHVLGTLQREAADKLDEVLRQS